MSLKSETDEIYDDLKKEKREKNPEKAKKKQMHGCCGTSCPCPDTLRSSFDTWEHLSFFLN
mgnify:CR=1 FL=1